MKKFFVLLLSLGMALCTSNASAQNMYIATNTLDYINFGTINGEFGLSPWAKCSFYIRGRYNPFTYRFDKQLQNRVVSGALGAKYWFWYSNSGWFINSHISYHKYNTGGIFDSYAYEGDAISITAGGGYALILNKKWNLDFGIGVQGGYTSYVKYACPRCGKVMENNKKIYMAPSNIMLQLSYML